MQEIKKTANQNRFKKVLQDKFLLAEKASDLKKISSFNRIKLCIVKTDFDRADLKILKKISSANPNVEFWISSNETSRKNILYANELGIKIIIPSPFDSNIVYDFFNQQDISFLTDRLAQNVEYTSLAGLKVMIVDDNLMNVRLLEEVLAQFELEISSFLKPQVACEMALREKFDLFLLDIMMPEMSGFDLAKIIKESEHNRSTPIVFISALSDSQNKITGYDLGSCAYIEKPFDINIIKSQIYNLLKNKKIQESHANDKETFMATVAHDLKTPLRAEINALQLLLGEGFGTLDEFQQEIIEDILNSTKFMRDMVENILCKNKIDSGNIKLSKEMCSLRDLAEQSIDLTQYVLAAKQQRVCFRCNLENPVAHFDFLEMKRVLHNLIANASQYSPCATDIIVEIFKERDKIGISVQDFGSGIDLENQKDVFVQYMSFAKQHKTVGSGLGLYITKVIVEAHGGEILLDSKVGFGTKISIIFPAPTKV